MRFIFLLFLSLFIHSTSNAQLLPVTVKKPTVHKTAPPAKKTIKPITEPIKETVTPPSAPAEEKKEVKPIVVEEKKSTLKIISDDDATLYVDGEKIGTLTKDIAFKLPLSKGVYNIKVVSSRFPVTENKETYRVDANGMDDIWNIALKIKEIDYWTNEVINTIKPFLLSSFIYSYKLAGKPGSYIYNQSIDLSDRYITSKLISAVYNSKHLEIANITTITKIYNSDIQGFSFKNNKDALNGEQLWLYFKGKALAEIYDNKNNNNIITPKTESEFIIRIASTKQSELEPKLIALFMQKPF